MQFSKSRAGHVGGASQLPGNTCTRSLVAPQPTCYSHSSAGIWRVTLPGTHLGTIIVARVSSFTLHSGWRSEAGIGALVCSLSLGYTGHTGLAAFLPYPTLLAYPRGNVFLDYYLCAVHALLDYFEYVHVLNMLNMLNVLNMLSTRTC